MLPTTPYSYITFAQARQALADRLFDSTKVFWPDAELKLYFAEALRTWNALTSYWRDDFTFSARQNVRWYDLTDTTNLPNTLRPLTLKDTDLYSIIQAHLLEPIAWNPWTGSSLQFSTSDLMGAVGRVRDEVLDLAAPTITQRLVPAVAGRIALPDSVIDIRRMAYLPAVGSPSVMFPDDTWAEESYNRLYVQTPAGTPDTYLQSTEPPISFDTDKPPGAAGSYELLTVEAGPTIAVGTPTPLLVPDDWAWVIKWGALADLLSRESNAKDTPRAQYCSARYKMGLTLLSQAPALLAFRINNVPVPLDSVRDADLYQTSWEAQAPGPPTTPFYAGLNLFALSPIPDAGLYSCLATVVRNAPIPMADGDFLQVSRDDLDSILDYCQHLAAFKQGGGEFLRTISLAMRFFDRASFYGLKLAELGEYTKPLLALAQREGSMNPRTVPSEAT